MNIEIKKENNLEVVKMLKYSCYLYSGFARANVVVGKYTCETSSYIYLHDVRVIDYNGVETRHEQYFVDKSKVIRGEKFKSLLD